MSLLTCSYWSFKTQLKSHILCEAFLIYRSVCMYVCIYIYIYTHTHTHTVCVYIGVYIYIYIYTHTHTHTVYRTVKPDYLSSDQDWHLADVSTSTSNIKIMRYFYAGWQAVCCPEPLNHPPWRLPTFPRIQSLVSIGPPGSWRQSYGHIHSDCRVGIYFEQTRSSQSLALPLISQTWELISYLSNRDNTVDFIGLLWRLSELIHKMFRPPSKHSINANHYYIFFFIIITAIYWMLSLSQDISGPCPSSHNCF